MVTSLPQAKLGKEVFIKKLWVLSLRSPAGCYVADRLKRSKREAKNPWEGARGSQGKMVVARTQGCAGGDGKKWTLGGRWQDQG